MPGFSSDKSNFSSDSEYRNALLDHLAEFITDHKIERMEEVLNWRTHHLTVVLEDIYQPHNASAVIRSCDCFGIQDLHIIENRNRYTINPGVAMGSSKWVTMHRYREPGGENSKRCVEHLKNSGFRLVATTPDVSAISLVDLDIQTRTAILFGTEETGLSNELLEAADEKVRIPMFGFTESFNISVSVALVLQQLVQNLHRLDVEWRLSDAERDAIKLDWFRAVLRRASLIEREFNEKQTRVVR